ncbi:chromosome-associated kinesin KIF4-like [Biomphalaria glabrata]|uniref:Chromosome-associated kinesin KIF4-like n=1 Tax=Biomphalaria glabrata TaxID=6526 RepID=A0A9U8EL30_BIOGL|nr:chromosome-associated kinesin KIF4-like [Biomphalaria glabrata]
MTDDKGKTIPVMVALRCRPLIDKEVKEGCQPCLQVISGEPQVVLGKDRAFTYDFAFAPNDPQVDVYSKACKKLIASIFKGYNATILAYGQTGSGKTFTMGGCYKSSLEGDEDDMGVIPRVLRDIFKNINDNCNMDYTVTVSYIEIYNEDLNDLLCSASQREQLSIREETNGGIKIQGLKEVEVKSFEETMKYLSEGSQSRTTGATAMNNTSSRSHAIFTVNIDQRKKDDINDCCKVKFHLVDLAGSERCKRTQAEGERFKEGVNINRGLLALGNVISALGEEGTKRSHIPYRDSKLTRILQDSLGGNSHTLMIACVSPADSNIEETLNTLRYADRARKIKNKPIINRDPQAAEIMRLKTLVQQLQGQLLQGGISLSTVKSDTSMSVCSSNTVVSTADTSAEEIAKLHERIKTLEAENYHLTKELQHAVGQSTHMLDQVVKLEASNEKLKLTINQVKDYVGIDLDLLSASMDLENNPQLKAEIQKLQKLTQSVRDVSCQFEDEENEEENKDELESSDDENAATEEMMQTPDSRAIAQKHVLRQAELHRELNEINKMLTSKLALAEKMSKADEEMDSMRQKYDEMAKEFKAKTEQLEREKEELTVTLQDAQTNTNAAKVAEQRRQRLRELEQQMAQLKKKISEQSKIVKMKESSDKQVSRLSVEIQSLKQQRVKLLKQMKEEMANFQKWKKEKDKEVLQLQQKDRKREFELQRLKKEFEKHQSVQKRKTAEAIAANKRLREALAKQKEVETERTGKLEKYDSTSIGNRVRKWLSHELDVKVSMREAQYHLAQLMENRKNLTERLRYLSDQLEDGPLSKKFSWLGENGEPDEISFEEKEIKKQMTSLELDIELINAHIQELQQKIVDADQESKGKSTWQSLHTMNEAKCALKFLLDQAVSARADSIKASGELRTVQDKEKEDEDTVKELKATISRLQSKHERELNKITRDHDEKTLFLLNADNPNGGKITDAKLKDKAKLLAQKLESTEEQLRSKEKECEIMQQQITRMMYKTKGFHLLPDLNDTSSPFLNPMPKEEPSSSSLNSTFVVDEIQPPAQQEVKPLRKTRNKALTKQESSSDSSLENIAEKGEKENKTKGRLRMKKPPVKKLQSITDTDDKEADILEEAKKSPGFLKRRSGDDPDDIEINTSQERKRRKRTLIPNAGRFFNDLTD